MGPKPLTIEEVLRRRVVYRVPGMEAVHVREALPYKSAEGSPLCFDLYAPNAAAALCPAVILVHGGPIPQVGDQRSARQLR